MSKKQFFDASADLPESPVLQFDGKSAALLKRDSRLVVNLDNIHKETIGPLAEAEFWMIVELRSEMVECVYGVPLENVEDIVAEGKQTSADKLIKAKNRDELLKIFGAIKIWQNGIKKH